MMEYISSSITFYNLKTFDMESVEEKLNDILSVETNFFRYKVLQKYLQFLYANTHLNLLTTNFDFSKFSDFF